MGVGDGARDSHAAWQCRDYLQHGIQLGRPRVVLTGRGCSARLGRQATPRGASGERGADSALKKLSREAYRMAPPLAIGVRAREAIPFEKRSKIRKKAAGEVHVARRSPHRPGQTR